MDKTRVVLIGGGKIGRMITALLQETGDFVVTVADRDEAALKPFHDKGAMTRKVDASSHDDLVTAISGHDIVISAAPFDLTPTIAMAARTAGAHYFDLTEDVAGTQAVMNLAEGAETAFMPQCGLAPGFISIVAHDLASRFDGLDSLKLRVGALPRFPSNALKYNLTWSTDGLINEYCNPCDAIVNGEMSRVSALEGHEEFALDGVDYEAFNTSGGLGTLCETLAGKVRNLNYKTVRYPGHLDIVRLLIDDLRLRDRRDLLKDVLETALPTTLQDVIVVFVTASGTRDGKYCQESFATRIFRGRIAGQDWSAIQITTAAGVCAAVDMLRAGQLPKKGFIRQEEISLDDFLANRFGRHYLGGEALSRAA